MVELPSGTVTFLFTDIEGSTRLWEAHPEAMKGALARHDEILRDAVVSHGGHLVKTTGDGIHAVFGRAVDAVGSAATGQRALTAEHWEVPGSLRVRMGIHTGEAEQREGDYYGGTLNRAARLWVDHQPWVGAGGEEEEMYERELAETRDEIGIEQYDVLTARGAAMSYDEIVEYALQQAHELIPERTTA
jgi:hypothetical protein